MAYVGGPLPAGRGPASGEAGGAGTGGGVQSLLRILPLGALAASLTISSVMLGSRPSVWPLDSRITSATTMPPLQPG